MMELLNSMRIQALEHPMMYYFLSNSEGSLLFKELIENIHCISSRRNEKLDVDQQKHLSKRTFYYTYLNTVNTPENAVYFALPSQDAYQYIISRRNYVSPCLFAFAPRNQEASTLSVGSLLFRISYLMFADFSAFSYC